MARRIALLSLAVLVCAGLICTGLLRTPALAASPQVPAKGMVTVLDLGAKTCIPCRMMTPILAELEREYKGRAAVLFIDVSEDAAAAKRFGIRAIPTQIFFDKNGREISRHEGFMDKQAISARLNQLLAK